MALFITALSMIAAPRADAEALSSAPDVELWRLDCGRMIIPDISYFSDAFAYEGRSADIGNGCYLIRNGDRYLLWDAGLPLEFKDNENPDEDGWISSISTSISGQLAEIGLAPRDIDFIGVSHYHGDHIGQAGEFAASTLLMSEADAERIRSTPPGNARRRLSPWFDGGAQARWFEGDFDIFGDGSVIILATPGHTPGHSSLLVRLPQKGPVFWTGDLFHFRSEVGKRNVSRWNTSRPDTLASIERFEQLVKALDPLVVVQHDAADIKLLPAFPKSAH